MLSDARGLYPRLTARENIVYHGRLQGMRVADAVARAEHLARVLDMVPLLDRRTEGFSQGERMKPALELKPEVASLNMGSMNFGLYPMLGRYKSFAHDWEEPYLRDSDERIFKNTFRDIETILRSCAQNGTRFEIECYDIEIGRASCRERV